MKQHAQACLIGLAIAAPSTVVAGQGIASLTKGSRATVSGVVHVVSDAKTFILKDHSGTIPVHIGSSPKPITEGMPVTVHGTVDKP